MWEIESVSDLKGVTISFDLNGGEGTFKPIEATEGELVYLPSTEPTRSGFNFTGWKYKETIYVADTASEVPNTDAVLVAQWDQNVVPAKSTAKPTSTRTTSTLPTTGANALPLAILAGALLIAGTTTALLSRRILGRSQP